MKAGVAINWRCVRRGVTATFPLVVALSRANAQGSSGDLAKASQNPVGDLTLLPFQFNFNTGGGLPPGRAFSNVNFQPVFPMKAGTRWTVIARTIVPYLSIPVGPVTGRQTGNGDILQQFFLTPQKPGKLIWGVGPIFSFPTATNDLARTGSWAVGPVTVWLIMPGQWTIGSLLYNLWTFSDADNGIEVNQLAFQPIVNYNLADGWTFSYTPIWTANWDASGDETWTIPLGLGVSKVTAIGSQPMSLALQYWNNVVRPDAANEHQVRFVVSALYPTKKSAPATTANGDRQR